MRHCKDVTGFRTRVAPHCAGDPSVTACKLAVVEATRYGYGYGCLEVPIFGLDAPPYSVYVCEGEVPPQLHTTCRESGYSIPSPQPPRVPENGTGSNVVVKTTAAVAPVALVGVGVVAMRKAREKRSQALTRSPSRILNPDDIGRNNPENFNADGVFLEPEPAPLRDPYDVGFLVQPQPAPVSLPGEARVVEPQRDNEGWLVSNDWMMDQGYVDHGEPPARTLRGEPILFPTNR